MSLTIDGGARTRDRTHSRRRHGGPVVLATFASARLDARAARVAVESAADMGSTLVLAQVVDTGTGRRRARRAVESVPPALAAAIAAVRELADDLGVEVEALRVSSPRPVAALLGFVAARRPALVVFAADPGVLRRFRGPTRRRYDRFVAALAEHAQCLIWTAQEPVAASAGARRGPGPRWVRAMRPPARGPVQWPRPMTPPPSPAWGRG